MVAPSSLAVAGVKTHMLSGGKGDPIIFLHGLGASSYNWRLLLPAFAKTHAVYAPDLPGFGRSEKPSDFDYSLPGFARWVCSFMDTLGLPQAVLVGSSLGGAIAINFALDNPQRVSRLVLIGTPVARRNIPLIAWIARIPWLGRLLEPLFGPWIVRIVERMVFLHPNLITEESTWEYSLALKTHEGRHAVIEVMRHGIPKDLKGFVRRYRELKAPVLFIRGEHDGIVDAPSARSFCQQAPQARFLNIPDCAHMPHEEQPETVEMAIREFLV